MPSRKLSTAPEPDRVLNRLNQKLKPTDIRQVKDTLYHYLYKKDLDPDNFKVNTASVNSIIGHLEDVYKTWEGLPDPIEPVYTSEAITHLSQTLINLVNKCINTTRRKIKELKSQKSLSDNASDEEDQIKDEPAKETGQDEQRVTRQAKRKHGDITTPGAGDQAAAQIKVQKKDTSGELPKAKLEQDQTDNDKDSDGPYFDPMALNDEQVQLVDNELNCQYYFKKLELQKKKIKKTYRKWKFYHKKSVYHVNPFPGVFADE